MAITWKKKKNFSSAVILQRIESIRTISPQGVNSFSGFELHDAMPALQTMLEFPSAADEVGRAALVWKALSGIKGPLTPKTFLAAINAVLAATNATKDDKYYVLTSVSLASTGFPARTSIDGASLQLLKAEYPKKYKSRSQIVDAHHLPVPAAAQQYCRVIIGVKAKTPFGAITRALRAVDIQRAIWCLLANSRMEFVGMEWLPINRIRMGSVHTVHRSTGKAATDQIWFEPSYKEASPFAPSPTPSFIKAVGTLKRALYRCPYGEELKEALLRYVRGLDESDQNNAVIKLWGALESLTSPPGSAQYDVVVRRCAFLFKETDYHRQILEHLRAYRNESIHSGEQSSEAKALAFQLQFYFDRVFRFHLWNGRYCATLQESNAFLDLPSDKAMLIGKRKIIQRALRFVS